MRNMIILLALLALNIICSGCALKPQSHISFAVSDAGSWIKCTHRGKTIFLGFREECNTKECDVTIRPQGYEPIRLLLNKKSNQTEIWDYYKNKKITESPFDFTPLEQPLSPDEIPSEL